MIKFVYFDVGGVAVKDFSKNNKWEKMLDDLGINQDKRQEFYKLYDEIENDVNVGLDLDSQLEKFKTYGLNKPVGYSMITDFVSRFDPNKSLWPVIEKVKERAGIGLLTNMYPKLLQQITEAKLLPPFEWEIIVDSSQVKAKKPDPKIYEIALRRAQEFYPRGVFGDRPVHPGGEILTAKEILFVDNQEDNIEAAINFGWQTFYYDSADYEKSSQLLEKYITENL